MSIAFDRTPTDVQKDMLKFTAILSFIVSGLTTFFILMVLSNYVVTAIPMYSIIFATIFVALLCSLITLIVFTLLFSTGFMADYE